MYADEAGEEGEIVIPGELETFEEIKNRRAIHDRDDA